MSGNYSGGSRSNTGSSDGGGGGGGGGGSSCQDLGTLSEWSERACTETSYFRTSFRWSRLTSKKTSKLVIKNVERLFRIPVFLLFLDPETDIQSSLF